MGVPMNFDSGYNQSSVLMEPIQQPMISTPAMMSMDDGCSCGSDCGGGCASNMGLGNGSLGLGSFGIGSGLGSGLGGLSQGGPMYAFFDFGVNFSENDSFFSDAVAGQLRGRPFGHKDAFIFGAGLGRYITSDMRVDFGARYRHLELEDQIPDSNGFGYLADGGNSVWTGMVTARHNLPGFHPCIKPYFSLGGGLAYHRAQASSWITGPSVSGFPQAHLSEETTEFAWSVGGGVAFKMTSNMFFDVDYQYIDMGDAATGTDTSGRSMQFGSLTANEVVFRLRYNF
jgi:opacity protein-like surface antigen